MALQEISIGVIPERIRSAVSDSGYSGAEVSRRIGVSQNALQQWFSGEKTPNTRNIALLAHVTRRPVGFFFGEEDGLSPDLRRDLELGRRVRELLEKNGGVSLALALA